MHQMYQDKTREQLIEMIAFYKHDALTGMKMRRDFEIEFSEKFYEGGVFFLVMFDVNGLHAVNRLKGYAEGDKLIKRVAERIKYYCSANSYRYGGDEFMVIADKEPDFSHTSFPESCHEVISSESFDCPDDMIIEVDRRLCLVKEASHVKNDRRV